MADHATLEKRIIVLEDQVAHLLQGSLKRQDWRRTVGMFSGDDLMKQIDQAGRRIREEDRQTTLESLNNK